MVTRSQLEKRAEQMGAIKIGMVGAGAMGKGTLSVIEKSPGMKCAAIADLDIERAVEALESVGVARQNIVVARSQDEANAAVEHGDSVVTDDGLLLPLLGIDAVIEATGCPSFGAKLAFESIMNKKHVIMLTVEADVVVGPALAKLARNAGVVYTLAAGDQPGAILELYHWADSLGFDIVAAGRGLTMYPDDRYLGPREDDKGRILISENPKMLNSFKDGSKAHIEMTAVSNCTGLVPDTNGIHEAQINCEDLARVLSVKTDGGILSKRGVVEIVNSVGPDGKSAEGNQVLNGVFIVIDSDHPEIRKYLRQAFHYQGDKQAALIRPYHLTCLEVPISVSRAVLYGTPTAAPIAPVSDAVTRAKRDLKPGEILDGCGGGTVYAHTELYSRSVDEAFLPIAFAENVRLVRPIKKDQAVTFRDVEIGDNDLLLKLRELQNSMFRPK